jgi:hypothetical protein
MQVIARCRPVGTPSALIAVPEATTGSQLSTYAQRAAPALKAASLLAPPATFLMVAHRN